MSSHALWSLPRATGDPPCLPPARQHQNTLRLYIYIYVYMYICIYIYIYMCIYGYIYMSSHALWSLPRATGDPPCHPPVPSAPQYSYTYSTYMCTYNIRSLLNTW